VDVSTYQNPQHKRFFALRIGTPFHVRCYEKKSRHAETGRT
jgi:hypothetical protein